MQKELNRFLHYLKVEKGYSQGTIEAYRLDIEKGLIPFLREIEIATPEPALSEILQSLRSFGMTGSEGARNDRMASVVAQFIGR